MGIIREAIFNVLYQLAKANSKDEGVVDEHWKVVLPEVSEFGENEIFLIQNRHCITEKIEVTAWEHAKWIPLRDVSQVDVATLTLHAQLRNSMLKLAHYKRFQLWVEMLMRGVEAPNIVLPFSLDLLGLALIKRNVQIRFISHCFDELVRRNKGNNWRKHTFGALVDRPVSIQWLYSQSHSIAKEMMPEGSYWEDAGSEALKRWWENDLLKLSDESLHVLMQQLGITKTAIKRNILDEIRKVEKQRQEVSLEAMEEEGHPPTVNIPLPSANPEEIVVTFTDQQIAQLDEVLGETGRKILVYIWQHRDLVDEGQLRHGANKEIAKAVGCDPSTVGEYIGTKNKRGKFKLYEREIREIL